MKQPFLQPFRTNGVSGYCPKRRTKYSYKHFGLFLVFTVNDAQGNIRTDWVTFGNNFTHELEKQI
jgi:hypothetical protein